MVGRPKGHPKSGGRVKGKPNKTSADLRAAASEYTVEMLQVLVALAKTSESHPARVSAAIAVLDRGHGRPTQTIAGDKENPLLVPVLNVTIGGQS